MNDLIDEQDICRYEGCTNIGRWRIVRLSSLVTFEVYCCDEHEKEVKAFMDWQTKELGVKWLRDDEI